jgi:pimeloyl-ACP methyl ester carboxylesterase
MPTVAIEGHRFYYEEQGSGTPLLLIHAAGGDTGMFRGVVARLATSHRVITYDRRGYTQSRAVPLPSSKEYLRRSAADAAALLREIGAPRAVVMGWSMGGVIALALAVHHPDDVSRVILYEPLLHARKHLGIRMTRVAGGALGLGKVGLHRRGAKRFLRYLFGYNAGGNAFDELEEPVRESLLANARTLLAEAEAGSGEELSERDFAKIRGPLGLIVGSKSARFLQQAVDRCAKIFPAARVIRVTGGDHVMSVRQPDLLVGAIRELLSP